MKDPTHATIVRDINTLATIDGICLGDPTAEIHKVYATYSCLL